MAKRQFKVLFYRIQFPEEIENNDLDKVICFSDDSFCIFYSLFYIHVIFSIDTASQKLNILNTVLNFLCTRTAIFYWKVVILGTPQKKQLEQGKNQPKLPNL